MSDPFANVLSLFEHAIYSAHGIEAPADISDEAAKALYIAARVALRRGNLDSITEHGLRNAIKKAEEL